MKRHWLQTVLLFIAVMISMERAWSSETAGVPSAAQPDAKPIPRAGGPDPLTLKPAPEPAPVAVAPVAKPAAKPPVVRSNASEAVTLNFVNAEIEGVVKAVSEITGKNFLLDPRVKGTVNIVSAKPMPKGLVYDTFLSALRLQGFAVVEERGIAKILPEAEAKLYSGPTLGPQEKSRMGSDTILTQVFTLRYESAAQLVPILRPLISANNTITAYPNTNTLVITDYASNLQRLERIIDSIDQPSGMDPVVIPLYHASALDVVQAVNRLFTEPASSPGVANSETAQRMTIVADARSNSLIARADNPSRLARLRTLVATLDTPTSAAGNIHVVFLKNADAVKVAETLRAVYSGESAPSRATPAAASAPPSGPSPSASPQSQAPAGSPFASTGSSSATGRGIVQADVSTNSVIITAPDAVYNNLRAVIDKLDTRRVQVYVEALIAEVTANKAAEFGVQWQSLGGAGANGSSASAFGGTNFGGAGQNIIGVAQNAASAGPGLNVGIIKGSITIPGVNGPILNMGLLVRALESDSNANILSTPTLLTLDNEEARIVVGQNLPIITGQYALSGASTTPTPFQTISRQDVGLQLRIKPQVSAGGTVKLQIYQEVSSVQDSTNASGVITNKRSVESSVLVDDGQIVVIGGLIQDSVNDTIQKIPVLGDMPLFGGLFQYKTRSRSKTNLMVFLRTTVLRDAERANGVTNERYDYIQGEQRNARPAPSSVIPNVESPSLPARGAPAAR